MLVTDASPFSSSSHMRKASSWNLSVRDSVASEGVSVDGLWFSA